MLNSYYRSNLIILIYFYYCVPQAFAEQRNTTLEIINRIINGTPAKLGEFPYQLSFKMLSMRSEELYKSFCGGSLISSNKVVSAAHCFEHRKSRCLHDGSINKRSLQNMIAVAGNLYNIVKYTSRTADSSTYGQFRRLSKMFYPTSYDFPKNDIIVGYTTKPFIINSFVSPIPFSTKYKDYKGKCITAGYGRIGTKTHTDVLLWTHLRLASADSCSKWHKRSMSEAICVYSKFADVAKGDSGGPLVCTNTGDPKEDKKKGILVGVTSGQSDTGGSFFTRVSSFSKFIEKGTGNSFRPNSVICLSLIYGRYVLLLFCFALPIFPWVSQKATKELVAATLPTTAYPRSIEKGRRPLVKHKPKLLQKKMTCCADST